MPETLDYSMKPLVRWTMGKVAKFGWETLSESIRQFSKVYPEFDRVICYNNLSPKEVKHLSSFGVDLHEQRPENCGFPFRDHSSLAHARCFAWKLVPPRLRPGAHELWLDNDIVIRERILELDIWLQSDMPIISCNPGPSVDYGRFEEQVMINLRKLRRNIVYCAGFFGLPSGFDFQSKVKEYCSDQPLIGYDEQGLVSRVVSEQPHYLLVSLSMMGPWTYGRQITKMFPNIHFVRVNQEEEHHDHIPWRYYKEVIQPH